jgi:hypothetical protein
MSGGKCFGIFCEGIELYELESLTNDTKILGREMGTGFKEWGYEFRL